MADATPPRGRRSSPLLAVAALAATLSGGQATAQQSQEIDREDRALAFAQCMRDNGVPEFADPGPDGRMTFRIEASGAARFEAAQEACRDLSPFGLASGPPDPERMEQLVKLAQCVRDNGVPEFPDPNAQGQFSLGGAGSDVEGPTLQAAIQTCMPAGGGPSGGGAVSIMITR